MFWPRVSYFCKIHHALELRNKKRTWVETIPVDGSTSASSACGIASLDHKIGDDSMELHVKEHHTVELH